MINFVQDLLAQFGTITVRPMFGGFGVYKDGLMFALIADDELYFKADKSAAEFFQKYESMPFTYESKGKQVKMSYWKVVPEVFEERELLQKWVELAYNAAITKA